MEHLIEDIKIVTLFALSFFSIFLITYKKGGKRINLLLGLVYTYQALESLNGTFYRFFDYWSIEFPWVFYSTEITFFLCGPTIFFFFRFAIDPDDRFTKKSLVHLIPAVLHTAFLFFKFHWHSNEVKTALLQSQVMSPTEDFVIHFLKNAFVIFYLIISAHFIIKAEVVGRKNKSWLIFFLVAFVIVEIIQILHFIDLMTRTYNTVIYNTTSTIWCIIAIATMYKVLQNPLILLNDEDFENQPIGKKSIQQKEIINPEFDELVIKIKEEFIDRKMFFNPELNLQKASIELSNSSKKVSQVINEHFKMSFSDFLNFHRIEEAKVRLANPEEASKTIIEIAYEVGFNSKATFNRAFTKFVGQSPTQYKKSH